MTVAPDKRPKSKRSGYKKAPKSKLGLICGSAIAVILGLYFALIAYSRPNTSGQELRFDTFVDLAEKGRIKDAKVLDSDGHVVGRFVRDDGSEGSYDAPYLKAGGSRERLVEILLENRVPTRIEQQPIKELVQPATLLAPALLGVVIFIYFMLSYRQGSGLFAVQSGARKTTGKEPKVTFADVAGQDAAVAELQEIVQFLSDPQRYTTVGARIPRGLLVYGPPGCGKTLLARALAGESGASFYSISGSDFLEMYVGVGAARVRELFREARDNAPAIVFIDELDTIGRSRGVVKTVAAHGEQEQALNQILAEMDGFSPMEGIIVLGATNRPDVLDQALLRPGRFDRSIGLERPDEAGRLAILQVHARDKVVEPSADLGAVAKRAIGLTGADLASVMNEAALLTGREGRPAIAGTHLELALQRILEAPERQRRLSMRDRRVSHRYTAAEEKVTFANVGGVEEVIEELAEMKEYLADPERYAAMGVRIPRGILLEGPPGCGKTLLARALSGEANAAFLYVAATEFVEVFVGEGAARVRDLFSEARAIAPAIVFIDELDAVGARRSTVSLDGNREQEQTLNQILVELDGFEPRSGVIVMGATNRADILDPALIRPGRFDLRVTINLPSRQRRREILEIHARGKPLGPAIDLDKIAALTQGFSGAALANVMSESVMLAARRVSPISMAIVEEAIERTVRGVAPVSRGMGDQERRMAAYHEAGHALVGRALPGASVPHRLSIIPMGNSLGSTWNIGTEQVVHPRSVLLDQMAAMLGGRAAEQLVFGEPGSGAADDLERVASLARRMVCEYGMSDSLGWQAYRRDEGGGGAGPGYSEETSRQIDGEIRALVEHAGARAMEVLRARRPALDRVATVLLEQEVLTAEQFQELAAYEPTANGRRAATRATKRPTRPSS